MSLKSSPKAGQILSYSFLVVFKDKGIIDEHEFNWIKRLALADEVVDEDERNVLKVIFDRLDTDELSIKLKNEINTFRRQYDI